MYSKVCIPGFFEQIYRKQFPSLVCLPGFASLSNVKDVYLLMINVLWKIFRCSGQSLAADSM